MGVEKNGEPGANLLPVPEIHAKITCLEGCRGSTSKQLIARYKLDAGQVAPDVWIGIEGIVAAACGTRAAGLIQHTAAGRSTAVFMAAAFFII